jgi:2-dehydropantoate 2-reductase
MTYDKANILLIGFGGVGTIVSYTLEHLGRSQITVVCKPERKENLENGYRIESLNYGIIENYIPSHIVENTAEAMQNFGPFDYIIITTKNIPDISPIVDIISDCYDDQSTIVLIQNGINNELPIFEKYPNSTVISGITLINTTLYHDTVKHLGRDKIKFGPFINPNINKDLQIKKCKKFVELYANPNNTTEYEGDVKLTRWRKLVYNACINTTCALANVDLGRADIFGGINSIIKPAMKEVIKVAKSEGVNLPEEVIDVMCRGEDGVYYPPSMLVDVRNGNYIEHVVIIGNVVEIAEKNNISVPTLTVLNNLLKLVQLRTMETKGRIILPKTRPLSEDNYKLQFIN